MATSDPWDWSIDRVVQELCTTNRIWRPRSSSTTIPEPAQLEQTLRENEVTGSVLLVDVDDAVLKDDLGLKVLGRRAFVKHAISELRLKSAQYQAYMMRHQSIVPSDMSRSIHDFFQQNYPRHASSPALQFGQSQQSPNGFGDAVSHATGHQPSPLLPLPNAISPGLTNVNGRAADDEHKNSDDSGNKRRKLGADPARDLGIQIDTSLDDHLQDSGNQAENSENGILTPAPEPVSDPAPNGKKRKRIAPTLVTSELDPNRNRGLATEADTVIRNDPQNVEPGVPFIDNDGKKRLVPVRQPDPETHEPYRYEDQLTNPHAEEQSLDTASEGGSSAAKSIPNIARGKKSLSAVESLRRGYLGRNKMAVDELFYHGINPGQELPASDPVTEFCESPNTISTGQRLYVQGVMKHFLRSERQLIMRDGKFFSAIRPYSQRLARRFEKPSFTLYYSTPDGEIHARREDLPSWPEVDPNSSIQPPQASSDEHTATFNPLGPDMINGTGSYENWDPSCLEKYKQLDGGDEVLPLYGESDEENEYDLATWKEIEQERGSRLDRPLKPTTRQHLGPDDINDAIDEGIAELVAKWKMKILPKRQRREWSLWTQSRKRDTKRIQIIAAQKDLDNILQRIAKLRKEITTEEWTRKLQVKKQTRIMETNIFVREDLIWKISTLEQKRQPEKPQAATSVTPSKKAAARSDDCEGGESIGSDSDTSSSDDGPDDFIVSDDPAAAGEEEQELNLADTEDENEDDTMSEASFSDVAQELGATRGGRPITPSKKRVTARKESPSPVSDNAPQPPLPESEIRETPQGEDQKMALPKLPISSPSGDTYMIDLTMMSSDDGPEVINLVTPRKRKKSLVNLVHRNSPLGSSPIPISDGDDSGMPDINNLPPYNDPPEIARYPRQVWEKLEERHRLLIKTVYSKTDDSRSQIFSFISTISEDDLWANMHQLISAMIRGEITVKGMDEDTRHIVTEFIRLFHMYMNAKHQPLWDSDMIPPGDFLPNILKGREEWFTPFYEFCCKLEGYFQGELSPKGDEVTEDGDEDEEGPQSAVKRRPKNIINSEDDIPEDETPHKKRKKKIFEDAQARDLREHDRQRLIEQEERRKRLQANLAKSGHAGDEDRGRIIINMAKTDEQGLIYVNPHNAQRIKQHQVEGLRFLWNQIVANDKIMQGCLLAHTMGLGKTMQVITLLVAIAESASSIDSSVSSQVPEGLRVSRTLVLCPPTLIDNWMDELLTWSPKDLLGDFRKVDSSVKLLERLQTISSWYHDGGVLLLGYEMFRSLIANKKTAKRCALLDDEQHENVCKELLEGPNIIIADEAHKMKNASAAVTLAAIRFRSKSRIALTGSPLANNVEEYHTMIEWVAPNYLGPIFEFRAKYVEPIQAGLWHDSTAYERRKGLKMLGVLKEDLAPKVHRADMSVLKKDLPPKKEFVITVALTELQRKAYSLYVRSMISGSASRTKDGEVTQTTLWHWLAILTLLCNHPACFNAKLHERKEAARKGATAAVEDMPSSRDGTDVEAVEAIADDFNTPVWKVGVSQELIDDETKLFKEEAPELKSIELSNKVKILCQILDAAKAAGDKTLVFSQSIPTLNFLEDLCIAQGRRYARLDGSTKMSKRQSHTKAFNQGDLDSYLISTAAGGLGLNLPGANRVVIFDFKFNPIMEEQAVGRAYRIGQNKPTFVYRFIAGGTFEDSVHNKTIFKMQLASRVVDKKNTVAWAKKKIGEFLFEPKHVEAKDLSEFEGMDPKVLDKILDNQGEDSTIRAIVQSDTFEVEDDDTLTAEELKEVKQLLDDEQLKRSNPQKWQALQAVRSQQAFVQQIRPFQTPIRPPQATVNSSVHQPPMSSAQQFASSAAGIDVRPPILPPKIATYRMDESGTFGSNNPQAASNVILPPSALEVRSSVAGTNTSPPKSTLPAPSALTRGQSPIAGVNTKIRESPPATQTPSPLGDPILPSTLPSGRMMPTEGDGANSPRTPPSFRQFLSSNEEIYKKPGKIQSALAEAAAQSQSSGNISKKTAELSSAIKNAVRDKAKNEDAVKPILDAAAASLRANLTTSQALLDSRMSPDAFVRDIIRSTNGGTSAEDITKVGISSPSHSDILRNRPLIGGSTSEAATGLKESQIIEMDVSSSKSPVSMSTQQLNPTETLAESAMYLAKSRQPVKSLKTPVTKPSKHSTRRSTLAEEDARAMRRVEERRRRRIDGKSALSPQKPPERPLPSWAREDIDEAKSRGGVSRRQSRASSHASLSKNTPPSS